MSAARPGVVDMFSARRVEHLRGILPECVTGAGGVGFCVGDFRDGAGGPIDAPYCFPSGSMRGADFGGFSGVVQRDWWRVVHRAGWFE